MNPATLPGPPSFVVFKPLFSLAECAQIIALAQATGKAEDGMVWEDRGGGFIVDAARRKVTVSCHSRGRDTHWIFERMDGAFLTAAARLEVPTDDASEEDIKIMTYGPGDHFGTWHRDTTPTGPDQVRARGISMSVELCDRASYTGGALQICASGSRAFTFKTSTGGAVAFRSDVLHRVTPVTGGVRVSLVNWISRIDT
jgi:PKHD-type hydroxylase